MEPPGNFPILPPALSMSKYSAPNWDAWGVCPGSCSSPATSSATPSEGHMLAFHLPVLPKRWTRAFKTCSKCQTSTEIIIQMVLKTPDICVCWRVRLESLTIAYWFCLRSVFMFNNGTLLSLLTAKRVGKHTRNMLGKHWYCTSATCTTFLTMQQGWRWHSSLRTRLIHSSTFLGPGSCYRVPLVSKFLSSLPSGF